MIQRVLNCVPDHAAARGNAQMLGMLRAEPPDRLDQSAWVTRIFDQGGTSRCVGFGLGFAMLLAGKLDEQPSAKWLYDVGRGIAHNLGVDHGTTIGAVVEGVAKIGFVRESLLPSTETNTETPPDWDVVRAAVDQRKLLAERLDVSPDARKRAIKAALASGYGVAIGMDVDLDYVYGYHGGVWTGLVGPRAGGHCQGALDYDDEALRCVGSYGLDWGESGLTRIAWPFICSERTRDIWIVQIAPHYSA